MPDAWQSLDGPEAAPPDTFALAPPLPLDRGGRFALAVGLSLALPAVVMLWSTTLGLAWSRGAVIAVYGLMALGFLGLRIRRLRHDGWKFGQIAWQDAALLAIFLFSLALRLAMVRDLAAPAWVDSVHHALFTRLIQESGAYPASYAPYLEIPPTTYHLGFHTGIAVFTWLSGLALPDALLLAGQFLNALCVLAVYLFTLLLARDRLAGVLAALVTGTLSLMPAYYVSWGRYTQLAGLLILPAALYLIWKFYDGHQRWRSLVLAGLACAGLFLVHYRAMVFLAFLLLAWALAEMLRTLNRQPLWQTLPRLVLPPLGVAAAAIGLTLPWWPAFWQELALPVAAMETGSTAAVLKLNWGLINPIFGQQALLLALGGLAWGLLRRRWFAPLLALWVGMLFLAAHPANLGLRRGNLWNDTVAEITLFIPISVLAGYLVASALRLGEWTLPARLRIFGRALVVLAAAALALAGAEKLLPIVNTGTLLARQADRPALAWAAEHLPPGEQVLINPFWWGFNAYAGQDGGFWMAPLGERPSLPPPVLYPLGDYQPVNRLLQQVTEKSRDPAALQALLRAADVHYIYTGARGGILSPRLLNESGLFQPLYQRDGVWIFEVK